MTKKEIKKQINKGNKLNYAFLVFSSLFETSIMILISIMIEKIMAIATSKNIDDLYAQVNIFIFALIATIVVYLITLYIKPKFRQRAILQYKNNIYKHILNKSIDDFNNHETSTYVSALTNDVNYIEENYIFSSFTLITLITLFITTVVVMIIYSPILTVIGIVLSLIPLVIGLIVGSKLSKHEKKISDDNATFMHFIKDNLIGFSTIKVFRAENKIKELFDKKNKELENTKKEKVRTTVLMEFLQMVSQVVVQFGVFFIGAFLCIKTNSIEPSVIILFVQLMNYIMNPLVSIPDVLSKRNACNPLFEKIANILDTKIDPALKEQIEFNNKITINNLEFAYDDKQILNKINFTFEKNKSYAIVGTSGSGKTTLLNLLIGRNLNYNGKIYYDEKELKNISIDSLFEITSFVEQNVFVFDDSIINNITMYSKIDDNILNDVIKKSGLEQLICEKGKDYKCGENGSNLSGGEKQRISIARALIKKSQILLMDEATSALDNETSSTIIDNVLNFKDTTSIMITHKLEEATLKKFDEIIVLKNGQIVGNGTFETLINNNYIFKSLYEIE